MTNEEPKRMKTKAFAIYKNGILLGRAPDLDKAEQLLINNFGHIEITSERDGLVCYQDRKGNYFDIIKK